MEEKLLQEYSLKATKWEVRSDLLNRGKWGVVDRHSFTSVDGYKKVVSKGLQVNLNKTMKNEEWYVNMRK